MKLGTILDDALTNSLEVFNVPIAETGEQLPKAFNISLLLLSFVVTVSAELEKNLIICRRTVR